MSLLDKILKKRDLNGFISGLKNQGSLFAPVMEDKLVFFKEIKDEIPSFDFLFPISHFPFPISPLKSLFLPQTEELFQFTLKRNEIEILEEKWNLQEKGEGEKRIILGAKPCDAKALTILDRVFLDEPEDYAYKKRRENTIIISLLCKEPDKTCFCTSLGYNLGDGSDILMVEFEDFYYLKIVTEKGNSLTSSFDEAKQKKEFSILCKKGIFLDGRFSFNSPIWKEVSQKCLGCGICTYLCPTCYCFDIQDEKTSRFRCWDSCAFSCFTKMAAHQPRGEQFQRFRNRIMHKFSYFPENFNEFACVGCGRCIRQCPVGMDIREVIEEFKI